MNYNILSFRFIATLSLLIFAVVLLQGAGCHSSSAGDGYGGYSKATPLAFVEGEAPTSLEGAEVLVTDLLANQLGLGTVSDGRFSVPLIQVTSDNIVQVHISGQTQEGDVNHYFVFDE